MKTKRISDWLRRIFARLIEKRPDSLEQWQQLEFRSQAAKQDRDLRRQGDAS